MASCSQISVQKYTNDQRSKSCDTVCSSNSSCFLQRRKPIHPLATGFRSSYAARSQPNIVRQRVLSAKLLKLKSVQNQLNDANFHLAELTRENQALKNLQKRQDKALSKYEGTNADLPRLLQTHEEEIRFLTERNKILRKSVKEFTEQVKLREDECQVMREQLKRLEKLNRDKHLAEREKLTEEVEDLKAQIKKQEEQISLLNRKIMLEGKNAKYKLNMEANKHRQSQRELSRALQEIDRLTGLLENREKLATAKHRFSSIPERQSVSLIHLSQSKHEPISSFTEKETPDELAQPLKEVKLQPISSKESLKSTNKLTMNGILKSPAENVKARLSVNLPKKPSEEVASSSTEVSTSAATSRRDSSTSNFSSSRPNSSQKLDKISNAIETTIQKAIENGSNEFDLRLGDYCSEVVSTVKNCKDAIENHRDGLRIAQEETNTILEALQETDELERKLKRNHLVGLEPQNLTDDSLDFVNQIIKDELAFKSRYQNSAITDKNGNVTNDSNKDLKAKQDEKRKLLAALKAIDNGDSVESMGSNGVHSKSKLLEELFGDIDV